MKKKASEILRFIERTREQFDPITFFTRTKFKHIFSFWIIIIILFGFAYFGLNYTENHSLLLNNVPLTKDADGLFNSLYFSVVSATATGYGDILPQGVSKLLATLQVILSLIIFGMLISKLVSYKQEVILEEIYEISFDEKINRLRSALYLFRADVTRLMDKIEASMLSKRKLQDSYVLLTSLENTMDDLEKLLCPKTKKDFIKKIDELKLELILNSIDMSLNRIIELLTLMNAKGGDWKTEKIINIINKIEKHAEIIYEFYKDKNLSSKTLTKINDMKIHIQDIEKTRESPI